MLDVHPPHAPTHTWRDFLIHIATIVVGLLIAIGLEQTVEAIHRAHERHLLEHELHEEAKLLQRNTEIDIAQYDSQLRFCLAQRKHINAMIASNGKADPPPWPYIAPQMGHGVEGSGRIALISPLLDSARAEGRLALLPEGLKRAYGLVTYRKGQWDTDTESAELALGKAFDFLYQFSNYQAAMTPVFSQLSQAQWFEYRALITSAFTEVLRLRRHTIDFSGELNLVLTEDLSDQRSLSPADVKVLTEARKTHPEDFTKMAADVDAEDAARKQP